jgi:hypothetical protein
MNGAASLAGRPAVGGFRAAWHRNNFVEQIFRTRRTKIFRSAGILPALFRAEKLPASCRRYKFLGVGNQSLHIARVGLIHLRQFLQAPHAIRSFGAQNVPLA